MSSAANPLPYTDTKPVGAADSYFAINATFRFVLNKFGIEGSRLLHELQTALPQVTGWRVRVVPAIESSQQPVRTKSDHHFCVLIGRIRAAERPCVQAEDENIRRVRQTLKPRQWYCPGGLWHMAVPVAVGAGGGMSGRWWSGRCFAGDPRGGISSG